MAKKVLTGRQKSALSWINGGCLDKDWEPSYYKTSARMLADHERVDHRARGPGVDLAAQRGPFHTQTSRLSGRKQADLLTHLRTTTPPSHRHQRAQSETLPGRAILALSTSR